MYQKSISKFKINYLGFPDRSLGIPARSGRALTHYAGFKVGCIYTVNFWIYVRDF